MQTKSKYEDQKLVNYATNIDARNIIVLEDYLKLIMYRILNEPLNTLLQSLALTNFNPNAVIFRLKSLDDFATNGEVQTFLNQNKDNETKIGIIYWEMGNEDLFGQQFVYLEPHVKKIDDKWVIHG